MKTEKSTRTYSGVFLVLLFASVIYLYYPEIQNYSTTPKWLFLAVLSVFPVLFLKNKRLLWSLGMGIWFLFVLQFLMACYWSYNFWDAVTRSVPLIIAPILVTGIGSSEENFKRLFEKMGVVAALLILPVLLYTLVQIVALIELDEYTHQATYAFRYSFGHRNQFVQFITLLIPLLFAAIVSTQTKWKKILFFATVTLIYITVVLSLNRTVFLILFGVYPLGILVYFIGKLSAKRRKYAYGSLLGIIIATTLVLLSPVGKKLPFVGTLLETDYGSGNERVRIWKNSLGLWKESPLFGQGSGDWKIEILKTDLIHTQAENSTVFYQRAHNDFIQVAVENGFIGLFIFVAFFIVGIVQLYRSNLDPPLKQAMIFGVLGFIVIANFSFPLEKVELLILLFFFLLPGFSAGQMWRPRANIEKSIVLTVLLLVLVLSVVWFRSERLYFKFKRDGDRSVFEKIDKSFYSIDPTSTPLYWFEGNHFYESNRFEEALPNYEMALAFNPYHVHAINNLGSCFYATGAIDKAEEQYKKALEINPRFVETLMNYSSLNFNRGNIDGALDVILKVPLDQEPQNYKLFISAIGKAKYKSLLEIYDEPKFENFLLQTYEDDELMYQISVNCRNSWMCFEDELRIYFTKKGSGEH